MNDNDFDYVDELPAAPRKDIPEADRQLLELAARALGARFEEVDGEGYGNLHFDDGTVVYAWNSLAFNGDTFELQVTLRMDVRVGKQNHTVTVGWGTGLRCVEEVFGSDDYVAARRAVTRAAAEIGKAMPITDT